MNIKTWCENQKDIDFIKLDAFITEFYNSNPALFNIGFDTKITLGSERTGRLLDIFDVTKKDYKKAMKGNSFVNIQGIVANDVINIMLTYAASIASKTGRGYDYQKGKKYLLFMAIKMYTSKYSHFFKFEVNKDSMSHFINSLDNTYYLKRYKTFMNAMIARIDSFISLYEKKKTFERMNDKDFCFLIKDLSTRISSFTTEIIVAYFKSDKRYLSDEVLEEDQDRTNSSTDINNMVTAVKSSISREVDTDVLSLVVAKNKYADVNDRIKSIMGDKKGNVLLRETVELLMDVYRSKYPNTDRVTMKKRFTIDTHKILRTLPSTSVLKKNIKEMVKIPKPVKGINLEQTLINYMILMLNKKILKGG